MTEPKPCPFCGKAPFVWRTTWDTYIECSGYDADRHRVMMSAGTDEKAVEMWNERWTDGEKAVNEA